jgi:hypothetical protein
MPDDALAGLVPVAQYGKARCHIFRSDTSFTWFVRQHRAKLIEEGALLVLAGRGMINPPVCDKVVLAVGTAAARESEPA